MKNSYILLFYILIVLFIGFLFYSFFVKDIIEGIVESVIEGFSLDSNGNTYYDNLSRLPLDNQWSDSTKNALLDSMNSSLITKQPSATPLTTDSREYQQFLQKYQPFATDDEVKYYINNNKWPWNGYITDYINNILKAFNMTDEQLNRLIKTLQTFSTNRMIYTESIMKQTVPQISLIEKLHTVGGYTNSHTKLECLFLQKGEQTQGDGKTKISIDNDGTYLRVNGNYTLDNNVWTTFIPGLAFKSKPCNICEIKNYTDLSNNCLFTIETPEAFKKYMGDNLLTNDT